MNCFPAVVFRPKTVPLGTLNLGELMKQMNGETYILRGVIIGMPNLIFLNQETSHEPDNHQK
jgi:hypothetical protein